MSVYAMAWAFEQDCPPTERFVLVVLADNIRENNHCWPKMETVARKTGFSRRTVINAIASLEKRGLLQVEKRTKDGMKITSVYRMPIPDVKLLRNDVKKTALRCESDDTADVNPTAPRCESDDICDVKEIHINRIEPSVKEPSVYKPTIKQPQPPDGVSLQTWEDFKTLRKAKRAPINETALNGIRREAEKAGVTLQTALETCCERGWQGFKAEWMEKEKQAAPAAPHNPYAQSPEDRARIERKLRELGLHE